MTNLDLAVLASVTGGNASQAQLRELGKQYCPTTAASFAGAKTVTRPMAETCLDEAGYGGFKGMLDKYFPRK